jgi:DNA-binding NarL/FixJ family response regulator
MPFLSCAARLCRVIAESDAGVHTAIMQAISAIRGHANLAHPERSHAGINPFGGMGTKPHIRILGAGGLELVERINTLPGYDGVPVMVTSGMDADAQVNEACRIGVLAFLVKPPTAEKVWPVIQALKMCHISLMVEAHDRPPFAL